MVDLNKRIQNFEIVLYDKSDYYRDIRVLQIVLSKDFYQCKYYYICHDRDFDNNGELIAKHYHLLVCLKNPVKIKNILGAFDFIPLEKYEEFTNNITFIKNKVAFIRYLIHIDNSEKTLYNIKEIITNDLNIDSYFQNQLENYNCLKMISNTINNTNIKSIYELIEIFNTNSIILDFICSHAYLINILIKDRKESDL